MAIAVHADSEEWSIGFGMYFTALQDRDYLRISRRFFSHWHGQLLNQTAKLIDPEGHVFRMRIGYINGEPYFIQGFNHIINYYGLSGKNYICLRYMQNKKFEIRIWNPSDIEIKYPKKKYEGVIVIESDSDDEMGRKLYWDKIVTDGLASGKNPLHIPAHIVDNLFVKGQRQVLLVGHTNDVSPAKILTKRKRRKTERYLGHGWYKFCRSLKLNPGDLISFSFVGGPKKLKVEVKRQNG